MLLVNMKQIDDNSPIGQYINSKISEYAEMEKPIEFESYLQRVQKRFLVDETGSPTGMREGTQGLWFGTQERFTVPKIGSFIINYCDNLPNVKADGTYDVRKSLIGVPKGSLRINPQENPDKAFFLCEISSVIRDGEVTRVNRELDDQKENDKVADKSMVDYMIRHNTSPISPETLGREDILRTLAGGWGIYGSEDKPIATIRKELSLKVHQSEKNKGTTKRGYNEFFNDVVALQKGGDADITIRKDINLGVEKGVLSHVDTKVILFPNTSVERELFRHRPTESDMWVDKLVTYFLNNPDVIKELKDELYFEEGLSNEDKNRKFDQLNVQTKIEQVKNMKAFPQVRKVYLDLGLPEDELPDEKKLDFMKEKIIEYYNTTPVN